MQTTAQLFKALSEEVRLRIVALLSQGELCVCEIMAALELPQSTVSRHLAYLKNCGWVAGRRQGVWMHYRLASTDSAMMRDIQNILVRQLAALPEAEQDRVRLARFRAERQDDPAAQC